MKLPKSFNEITISQFQECYFLLKKNHDLNAWISVLSTLSGKPHKYIEDLPGNQLRAYIKSLQFLLNPELNEKVNKYVTIRGKVFKANLFASEMKTNQVADLKALVVNPGQSVEDTIVENAHRLLACIYTPLTLTGWGYNPSKQKKVSQYFLKAKMGEVYGTLFFYSKTYKNLMDSINEYGEKAMKEVKEHLKEIEEWQTQNQTLENVGAGK